MSKSIDWDLIDYYIDRYVEEINHGTDNWVRSGILSGLINILSYYNMSDVDLGADRLNKITEGRYDTGRNDYGK